MNLTTKILRVSSLLFLLNTNLFSAQNGIYIELGGGVGLSDTIESKTALYVYDSSYVGTLALGYQYSSFRFEIEERYKKDELYSTTLLSGANLKVDGDLISNSQMFNLYYSGYNQSRLITTLGIGAGATTRKLQESIQDDAIFSMQALLSVGYAISEEFIFTTKYRYFHTQESQNFKADSDSEISLTLRYIF